MNPNFQDWEPVILRRRKTENQKAKTNQSIPNNAPTKSKNVQRDREHQHIRLVESRCQNDTYVIPKVSHDLQLQIRQARQAKNWTQKQLGQASNLSESIIRDYENGTIVPKSSDIKQIEKALGITFTSKR